MENRENNEDVMFTLCNFKYVFTDLVNDSLNDEKIWHSPDRLENYANKFFNISVQVESGLNLNPNCLAKMVTGILNDPRGWATVENR